MGSMAYYLVAGLVVAAAAASGAAEGPRPGVQTPASVQVTLAKGEKVEINYLIFLPADYGKQDGARPLLLFLHGAGERGDNLALVKRHGPPKIVDKKKDFPFIVVSPQCPKKKRWQAEQLIKLLDHVAGAHTVDRDRIYVTGLSLGGYGTWALAAAYPDRFAAAVPICGGGDPEQAGRLVNLPIWVFHGGKDPTVRLSQSEEMVNAIKAAGGSKAILTVYPEAGHDSWTKTYNNQEVYKWLLSHKRSAKK